MWVGNSASNAMQANIVQASLDSMIVNQELTHWDLLQNVQIAQLVTRALMLLLNLKFAQQDLIQKVAPPGATPAKAELIKLRKAKQNVSLAHQDTPAKEITKRRRSAEWVTTFQGRTA